MGLIGYNLFCWNWKLKTENWKHCSKINFKCVNSTMEPIFNEKIVKKWYLWIREQYIQYMNTLFTVEKSTLNSSRKPPETHAKKEKKNKKRVKRHERGSKRTLWVGVSMGWVGRFFQLMNCTLVLICFMSCKKIGFSKTT